MVYNIRPYTPQMSKRSLRDEVTTTRVSGWVKAATLNYVVALSHPLTRMVLTLGRPDGADIIALR